jgi:CheY-like chemotaxis protein
MVAPSSSPFLENDQLNGEKRMKETSNECPILLVEDNEDDIVITKRALEKGQIRNKLYVTHDGEEAINFLKRVGIFKEAPRPGFILLDLKMPKIDGFEVLKEIKRNPDLKSIPVVVLTTSSRDIDVEQSYILGCNNYIVKPVNFEKFIKIVVKIEEYWLVISKIP